MTYLVSVLVTLAIFGGAVSVIMVSLLENADAIRTALIGPRECVNLTFYARSRLTLA